MPSNKRSELFILFFFPQVYISDDGGAPIMLQILLDAAEQQLAVSASLSEMSVVGPCEVQETSSLSVAVSGAPSSAEPQASCQASSPTGMSDTPVVSGDVSRPVNADHPEMTVAIQSQVKTTGHVSEPD